MFADPVTFSLAGGTKTFNKISDVGLTSVYQTSDRLYRLTVSHTTGRATSPGGPSIVRRLVKLEKITTAANPLEVSGNLKQVSFSVHIVINDLEWGAPDDDIKALTTGLDAFLDTSGVMDKLLGDEH